MSRLKVYRLKHGWANKYYWLDIVQDVEDEMEFDEAVKNGKLTLSINKGTTEADIHGSTMALDFYSESIVFVLETHSAKSFRKYPVHFEKEAGIQGRYFYIEAASRIPDITGETTFTKPDLAQYCHDHGVEMSDLLVVNSKIWYLFANFSKWDGSALFGVEEYDGLFVTEALKNELSDKKGFKNVAFDELDFVEP